MSDYTRDFAESLAFQDACDDSGALDFDISNEPLTPEDHITLQWELVFDDTIGTLQENKRWREATVRRFAPFAIY